MYWQMCITFNVHALAAFRQHTFMYVHVGTGTCMNSCKMCMCVSEVQCRCFIMQTPLDVAHHLNFVRQNMTNGEVRRIPDVAYNVYKKNAEEPSTDEGFKEVVNIDFTPRFDDDTHRKLFEEWT